MTGSRMRKAVLGAALVAVCAAAPAQAAPLWPGGPDVPGVAPVVPTTPPPPGSAKPADPYADTKPRIEPADGAVIGGKGKIDVFYQTVIEDRAAAEASITITPSDVAGAFEWIDDSHVQWAPKDFWPRGTAVTVEVAGQKTSFGVSDKLTAVGDASKYTLTIKIGDDAVKTFPASYGKPTHKTPNGTFSVLERNREMVMDSSTYGVPIDSKEGYRLDVEYATRLTWSGIFVHAAPWSLQHQGNRNVSHGCINLSTENAKWFFENFKLGDQVTIVGA